MLLSVAPLGLFNRSCHSVSALGLSAPSPLRLHSVFPLGLLAGFWDSPLVLTTGCHHWEPAGESQRGGANREGPAGKSQRGRPSRESQLGEPAGQASGETKPGGPLVEPTGIPGKAHGETKRASGESQWGETAGRASGKSQWGEPAARANGESQRESQRIYEAPFGYPTRFVPCTGAHTPCV